jgi:hypothetical protein
LALKLNLALPFLALGGATIALPVAAWRIVTRRTEGWADILLAAGCIGGASTLFLAPVRADFHHIAYGGPFGMMALSLAARRPRLRAPVTALLGVAAALCVVTYAHKTVFTWSASRKLGDFAAEARRLGGAGPIARLPPDATIVIGPMAGFYYFFQRDAAVPITHLPSSQEKFLTDAQWRWCADEIVARRPAIIMLPAKSWQQIVARRPELLLAYKPQGGMLVRAR